MYAKVEEDAPGRYRPVLKVKGSGRVDLGLYPTARVAAVAHDVARLCFIHEKRPSTDLRLDQGLHFPADGYLVDPAFKELLDAHTPFEDVCELLRAGALADQFLCAQDRQTRKASSNTSGDRSTLSRAHRPAASAQQHSPTPPLQQQQEQQHAAAPAQQQQQQQHADQLLQQQQQQQQQHADQQQQQQQQQAGPAPAVPPEQGPPVGSPYNHMPEHATKPGSPRGPATTAAAAAVPAVTDEPGSASPTKKRPMRWFEYPGKGCGQFATCISDRALKNNMTLPAKMKRELFQVSESVCEVAAYDLAPGSMERWSWEVRDYVKEDRTAFYLYNLGPFFKHYKAATGDVMVAVASAPGAVKATIWKSDTQEAVQFKAYLDRQSSKQSGGGIKQSAGGSGKKRAADAPAAPRAQQPQAKVAKAARPVPSGTTAGRSSQQQQQPQQQPLDSSKRRASPSPEGASRQLSKSGSGPPHRLQHQLSLKQLKPGGGRAAGATGAAGTAMPPKQPSGPQFPLQPPSHEQLAAEGRHGSPPPSGDGDDTQQLSPTGQVVQSPFRSIPVPPHLPVTSMALPPIKQERQASPAQEQHPPPQAPEPPQQEAPSGSGGGPAAAVAATAGAPDGTGPAGTAATHSPARMSCADASPAVHQQEAAQQQQPPVQQQQRPQYQQQQQQQQASGAARSGQELQQQALPDALSLAQDEEGVYVAMSRLLALIASTGRVPGEEVSSYRRFFARLEPAGKRWWHYDAIKSLVDGGEWEELRQWLLSK